MKMNDLDKLLLDCQKRNHTEGNWFIVQWTPDLASDEKLNIGVGITLKNGDVSIRMLDYFERIKCLYDQKMIFNVQLACEVSREVILKEQSVAAKIGPQISICDKGFAQGQNIDEVLSELYKTAIPLGRKIRKKVESRFSSISRDVTYNKLKDILKEKMGMKFQEHVPENPYQTVVDGNVSHSLYLPYRKDKAVATLSSGAYSDSNRVKCNLYDGYRDIDVAHGLPDVKSSAIFILLPGDELKKDQRLLVENELDTFSWYMKKRNVYIGSHISIDSLGDEISNWCELKAS